MSRPAIVILAALMLVQIAAILADAWWVPLLLIGAFTVFWVGFGYLLEWAEEEIDDETT